MIGDFLIVMLVENGNIYAFMVPKPKFSVIGFTSGTRTTSALAQEVFKQSNSEPQPKTRQVPCW